MILETENIKSVVLVYKCDGMIERSRGTVLGGSWQIPQQPTQAVLS